MIIEVNVVEQGISIENAPNETTIVIEVGEGLPGPQGPPGPAGGSSVSITAGENLSAGRVVIVDAGTAKYFQPGTALHAGRAYGITITSATIGLPVDVQLSGELTDAAFSFAADKMLWVGANGRIYDTPQTGIVQKAGISSGTNKMKIDFTIQMLTI